MSAVKRARAIVADHLCELEALFPDSELHFFARHLSNPRAHAHVTTGTPASLRRGLDELCGKPLHPESAPVAGGLEGEEPARFDTHAEAVMEGIRQMRSRPGGGTVWVHRAGWAGEHEDNEDCACDPVGLFVEGAAS